MCMVRSPKSIAGAPEVVLGNSPYQIAIALRSAFDIALTNQLGTVGLQRDCYAVSLYGFKTSFAPSMKNLATG